MSKLADHLLLVLVTLWVGTMWSIGYIAAPTLFSTISDRGLAGAVAGRLFSVVGWIGIACAVYVMAFLLLRRKLQAMRTSLFWLVTVMLVVSLVSQFGIQPLMAHMKASAWPQEVMSSAIRERFATWHGISSVLYLLQSMLGLFLVFGTRRQLR